MALVQKHNDKKNLTYLALLGVAIIGGVVALFILKPKSTSVDTGIDSGFISGRNQPTYTTFDEAVFKSEQYLQLRDYLSDTQPVAPVNSNPGSGNPNPFRGQ